MAEYIDRNATLEQLRTHYNTTLDGRKLYHPSMAIAMRDIENMPAADVVEVVRCKDCEHCIDAHNDGLMYCMRSIEAEDYSETGYRYPLEVRVGFYGFCSYGERRSEQ